VFDAFYFYFAGRVMLACNHICQCAGQVVWVTKFYIMVPYNCASSVWKCFMSTFGHLEFEAAARFLEYLSI